MRSLVIYFFFFCLVFASAGCQKSQINSASSPVSQRVEPVEQNRQDGIPVDMDADKRQQEIREQELQEQMRKEQSLLARSEQERQQEMDRVDREIKDSRIYFEFDSFDLKPEARQLLQEMAKVLNQNQKVRILIEGHTDDRGTEEYNLALGERRARAAYEFLILLGVSSSQMQIISYGEEYPADPANNEAAWAKNRRDDFKVIR